MNYQILMISHKFNILKKILLLIVLSWIVNISKATTIATSYEGLNYEINTDTNEATCTGASSVINDMVIPDYVPYDSMEYPVTSISNYAFHSSSLITGKITFGSNLVSIGNNTFERCEGITSLDFSHAKNLTEIIQSTFRYCSSIETITFGENSPIKKLGDSMYSPRQAGPFGTCSSLISMDLQNCKELEFIGWATFMDCEKLAELELPISLKSILTAAFSGTSLTGELVIPDNVSIIGQAAFSNCNKLESVVIGKSVNEIGTPITGYKNEGAFVRCPSLQKVKCLAQIPPTMIGTSNFDESVFTNGQLSVPYESIDLYRNADGWKDFNKIYGIGKEPIDGLDFEYEGILYTIISAADKTVKTRENGGHSGLIGSLIIPSTVKYLEDSFTVVEIGDYSFSKYKDLTGELILPESLIEIGDWAFNECSGFTGELFIPNSVKRIGDSAFRRCVGFNSLTIGSSVEIIEHDGFIECEGLTGDLIIPESVTSIGNGAFHNCVSFDGSLIIGNSVKTIGREVFSYSKFISLTLGSSVASVGWKTFQYMNLQEIISLNPTPPRLDNEVFDSNAYTNAILYVPENFLEEYRDADYWKNFLKIRSLDHYGNVPAESIELSVSSIKLLLGESAQLMAKVYPEDTTDPTVTWRSEDAEIATVGSDGTVTAVAVGTVNITATCGEVSATCRVTVNPVMASSVTLNVNEMTLLVGQSDRLRATVSPENTTDKSVTWRSEDAEIATVGSDGTVTAVSVGTVNITATCGEVSSTCRVTVNPVMASSVTLNVNEMTLLIGQSDRLTATVSPENTTDKTVTWRSEDAEIATVGSDGTVTAVSVGTVNITATCGEVSATCRVTVNPIVATGVTLNVESMTLTIGQTSKITATVYPENTTDKTIIWRSDNEEIATVGADGTVTAVSVGIANITAICGEASATCNITVNPIVATDVTLNVESITLTIGQTSKITATVYPDNTTDQTITWRSDDEEIATVDANGTVTALSVGTANITATCGNISASCRVTVNPIVATGVTLNVESITLTIGQSSKITAAVYPENTTDKTVTWKSDNEEIATVGSDGTVTAVSVGITNITATCGEVSATCRVTVNPVIATGVTLNLESMTLTIGQNSQLIATVSPENTTDKTLTWKSDNEEIATVDVNGTVTAVSVGVANITATCGNVSATCQVTVNPIIATGATLNVETMTLTIGQTSKLTATVYPENTTDKTVTWKSDNEEIATVGSDGTVTAVSVGTVNITATCGEVSAKCQVTVNPVTATGVTLNLESVTLTIGQTNRLIATVIPPNTTDPTVTWSSDNDRVATVDADGTVTAVSVGTANITATIGIESATCRVIVNPIMASGVDLNMESMTLTIGQASKLTATVYPDNTTDKTVTWSSDNESVATVDAEGTVTAVSVGTANITATIGTESATCRVTVNPVVASGVTLNMESMTLAIGQTNRLTATVIPPNTTDPKVTWSSDDETVAAVDADGTVTAVSVGTANITATIGTESATCKVTVNPVVATGITLNVQAMTIILGESSKLFATVSPDNTTDKTVIWSSDNESVATVDADGAVTAHSQGLANITATCGTVSATCKVTVDPIVATGITLNVEAMTLILGESSKLDATVSPADTTDPSVTWISDNTEVAMVGTDGRVTAISVGTANITAICGNVTATCKITVVLPQPIGINLSPLTMILSEGESGQFTATFVPAAAEPTLTWTSDDTSIAEVSQDGTVTAIGAGIAIIYAISDNGVKGVATVNVTDNSGVSLNIIPEDLILTLGQTSQLVAQINQTDVETQVTWSSRDSSIVEVDSQGLIKAVGKGSTVISARSEKGLTGLATVTVIDSNEIVSIAVSPENLDLAVGGESQLEVIIQPSTSTQEIRWISSDTSIAEVNENGVVSGINPGVTIIYAVTENGMTGFSAINVVENVVTSIIISPDNLTLELDETAQLTALLEPAGVDVMLTWTSTDTTVATVDNRGVVTAKEPGYTFIYATSDNGMAGLSMVRVIDPEAENEDPDHGYGDNGVYISAVRIREGDFLGLFAERPLNYENNDWTYEWYLDNELKAEGKYAVVTAGKASGWTGTRKETFSEQYQVDIYNTIGDEILQDLPEVTVYSRPVTPIELIKKGDGHTGTLIALSTLSDSDLTALGYSFVFGYADEDGVNHIISNSPLRYCHTKREIYDNPQYRFWVYTSWVFPDGVDITSGLRYLDGALDENFDKSDFNNTKSGYFDSTEGETETFIFTLEGNRVGKDLNDINRLVPGIYIVVEKQGKLISTRKIIKR